MKKVTMYLISSIFVLASYGTASAGESTLTLNEAITTTLENNRRYMIAGEKVREKRMKVREVWGELWPEIGSGISQTWWNAEKGIMSGSDGQTNIQIINGSLIVNPGMFYNRLKSAREEHIIAVNEERKIRSEMTVTTIQLYYNVLLARDIVRLRTQSVEALQENLRSVESAYSAGTATQLVVLRATVTLANEKTQLINAVKDMEKARIAFNIHLGRDIDTPVVLDEGALNLESEADQSLIRTSDSERLVLYQNFVLMATQNRPEVLMLRHRKEMYNAKAGENDSLCLWPTFYVSGSWGQSRLVNPDKNLRTGYPDPTFDAVLNAVNTKINPVGWNSNWNITLGANYRWGALSPLDSSRARNEEIKSLISQSDLEMEDFMKSIRLDVRQGLLDLQAASNAYMSQRNNIASAEESLRVATLHFKNGLIDNTILLNANVELCAARAMYVQSLFSFQSAKAGLNRTTGCDYFRF